MQYSAIFTQLAPRPIQSIIGDVCMLFVPFTCIFFKVFSFFLLLGQASTLSKSELSQGDGKMQTKNFDCPVGNLTG